MIAILAMTLALIALRLTARERVNVVDLDASRREDDPKAIAQGAAPALDPYRNDAMMQRSFIPNEALGMKLRWLWGWQFVRRRLGGHWEKWCPAFLAVPGTWVRVTEPTSKINIELQRARTGMYFSISIIAREHWST